MPPPLVPFPRPNRTAAIADEIASVFEQGHKVLVLTERNGHLDDIGAVLAGRIRMLFTLHGRMSLKQRAGLITDLDALPPDVPRVLLSTGKLVGEGFDHPPLDTLVLAMPISWKGTLQQHAGRLHREYGNKTTVRIIDFVDAPVTLPYCACGSGVNAATRQWATGSPCPGQWRSGLR